ncbi:MAG: polymer-forming cytoskeletal protein [Nitrospirota bacterium]|nr:MAG: polymer-forming cytoskeletal protein [Nitrospirota bacterium]
MKERRAIDKAKKFDTFSGEESRLDGELAGDEHCSIAGKFTGRCRLSGVLRIETTGNWEGDIEAEVVIIRGMVKGNIRGRSKIEIGRKGSVAGNLSAPTIAIAEGGTVDGEIDMGTGGKVTHFTERREEKEKTTEQ